uniref:Uncharacterized protein n=1 Tax=Rhizophora mucronata TaxID=61149 RepID=A0A2P2LAW7_RHIMU
MVFNTASQNTYPTFLVIEPLTGVRRLGPRARCRRENDEETSRTS